MYLFGIGHKITNDLDLEEFLKKSEDLQRGTLGSAHLEWIDDDEKA
ncbi:hypothetical protein J573_0280 [Acinetobacter baumannii 1546444]|nr:hypothetical protein J573_0280 [Acinetobacter baumannii 1546444]